MSIGYCRECKSDIEGVYDAVCPICWRKRAVNAEMERDFLRDCMKEIQDRLQESAEPFDRAARIAAKHATKEE